MEFKQQYAAYQQAIEQYLEGLFSQDKPYGRLQEAMRYSILGGGKRIRPVLTLEFARLAGLADWKTALPISAISKKAAAKAPIAGTASPSAKAATAKSAACSRHWGMPSAA